MRVAGVVLAVLVACTPSSDTRFASSSPHATTTATSPSSDRGCPVSFEDEVVVQGCRSESRGDLDGDGREDLATVFAELGADDHRPLVWWLIVESTRDTDLGYRQRLRPMKGDIPRTIGIVDANGDDRGELFVSVAARRPVSVLHVFGIDGHGLFRFEKAGDRPFEIRVGGVASAGHGVECVNSDGDVEPELNVLQIDDPERRRPLFTSRIFEWDGRRLRLVDVLRDRALTDAAQRRRFHAFSCFGLTVPGERA